jgi:cytoskeletal protein RodZ
MTRKLYLLLIGAVVSGALVAACGGGSSTTTTTSSASTTSSATSTSSSAPTSTTTSATSTKAAASTQTATSTSTTTATTTSSAANPAGTGAAVVAVCKAEIQRLATAALTADEKAQLNHLCDVAGSGNTAQIKAAEKQICLTVIKDSAPGLSGAALAAAQRSCNKVGQTPAG